MCFESAEIKVLAERAVFDERLFADFALGGHSTERFKHFKVLIHVPVSWHCLTTHTARKEVDLTATACFKLNFGER